MNKAIPPQRRQFSDCSANGRSFTQMSVAQTRRWSVMMLALLALVFTFTASAQLQINVDSSKNWIGYINVFNLPAPEGDGGYLFGSAWATEDMTAVFGGGTNEVGPAQLFFQPNTNTYADNIDDPYWVDQTTGLGNKQLAAVMYVESSDLLGQNVTFSGTVHSNTLVAGYTYTAFVKVLDPGSGWGEVARVDAEITAGSTSFNAMLDLTSTTNASFVPQYGFELIGRNVNPLNIVSTGLVAVAVQNPDPLFTTQPVGQTVTSEATVELTVTTIGTSTVGYQWQKDGVDLTDGGTVSGATTATLTITGTQQSDSGAYTVTAANDAGSTLSAPAQLTVLDILITEEPVSQRVQQGSTVVFSVEATGASTLTYQWKFATGGVTNALTDGGDVSGATTDMLTLSNVQPDDTGIYVVTISTGADSADTSASLLVKTPEDYVNFLENPGFESDPAGLDEDPWTRYESTDPSWGSFQDSGDTYFGGDPVNVYEGTYVSFTSFNATWSGIYQDVEAEAGQIFRADMWFFNAGGAGGDPLPGGPGTGITNVTYLEVQFRNAGDQVIYQYVTDNMDYASPANTWFNLQATNAGDYTQTGTPAPNDAVYLEAPEGTTKVRFQITLNDIANSVGAGSIYYDSARLMLKTPATLSVSSAGAGTTEVSWQSLGATTYQVQYKDNLSDSDWMDLEQVPGDGSVITRSYPTTGAQRFYRVLTL